MSNAGQAVLTVVGAAVGFYFGGPSGAAWGAQLGGLAGSVAFPTDLGTVSGPRLNDLRVQTSEIGAPIPIVYGAFQISGNVIWAREIKEVTKKKKVGGKGGAKQTVKTFSYFGNCAVGVCEGRVDAIRRVWADEKLIYDDRDQFPDETDEAYDIRAAANTRMESMMQIHLGSEDQLPDTVMEYYEGVGDVSAYRGLCYVVFVNFPLEDYGNRLPNFRFEPQRCIGIG